MDTEYAGQCSQDTIQEVPDIALQRPPFRRQTSQILTSRVSPAKSKQQKNSWCNFAPCDVATAGHPYRKLYSLAIVQDDVGPEVIGKS